MKRYPSVLIGRLGVSKDFSDKGIGSELMEILKRWCVFPDNMAACRYLAVDSYNCPGPLNFYLKNGFQFLFSSEEQEAEHAHISMPTKTRFMFFDLLGIVQD